MTKFSSGTGKTTKIGFVNKHDQICLGTRGKPGNHNNQKSYMMLCVKEKQREEICGRLYGSNGCDIHEHLCPCESDANELKF